MIKEVIDYEIVKAETVDKLTGMVKEYLGKGWQPYGEFQISMPVIKGEVVPSYIQVMVKIKK